LLARLLWELRECFNIKKLIERTRFLYENLTLWCENAAQLNMPMFALIREIPK